MVYHGKKGFIDFVLFLDFTVNLQKIKQNSTSCVFCSSAIATDCHLLEHEVRTCCFHLESNFAAVTGTTP
jgi:hypothetical protein